MFMRSFTLPVVFAAVALAPGQGSADAVRVDRLFDATRLTEIVAIMSQEGIAYADTLQAELFPGEGGAAWQAEVERIHASDRAIAEMRDIFVARLSEDTIDPMLQFYESPLGVRIVDGEVIAREAFLDETAKDTAKEMLDEMIADQPARISLINEFIEVNDLIESNVVGGLNSNFAFYRGLEQGGAFPYEITESQMLTEVWQQEAEMRTETEDWLLSYLGLAYAGLTDAELETYVLISSTDAGDSFNAAVFAAFDAVFNRVSEELGEAAARYISAEDA